MPALVSVVVPSYNHARYLPRMLEGVLAQTWADLELLLIDDGSKDDSVKVIRRHTPALEKRLRRFMFRARENRGVAATQNELIAEARGDYLFFCASDDVMRPTAVARLLEVMERSPDAVLAVGDSVFIGPADEPVYLRHDSTVISQQEPGSYATALAFQLRTRPHLLHDGNFGRHHTLLQANYVPVGALIRTEAARRALPYPSGIVLEDLAFLLKLSRYGRFVAVDECLMEYRLHGGNVSRTRQARMRADHFKLLLEQRSYAESQGHLDEWQRAMESVLSLRNLSELREAHAAGLDTLSFFRRRIGAHVRRLLS